jgi:hypothetical protein
VFFVNAAQQLKADDNSMWVTAAAEGQCSAGVCNRMLGCWHGCKQKSQWFSSSNQSQSKSGESLRVCGWPSRAGSVHIPPVPHHQAAAGQLLGWRGPPSGTCRYNHQRRICTACCVCHVLPTACCHDMNPDVTLMVSCLQFLPS